MFEILLINDDGLYSPGLRALLPIFSDKYNLTVVAPPSQRSWLGKATSYHHDLNYEYVDVEGVPAILFDGTPADCAVAGIYHFCRRKPNLLVSGINIGANIGDSYILSSGTVGGAIEGALAEIPSIAIGIDFSPTTIKQMEFNPLQIDVKRFEFAATFTGRLARCLLEISSPPIPHICNLNFFEGANESSEVVLTRPARYNYGNLFEKRQGLLFHRGAKKDFTNVELGTDMAAIRAGKISLSILDLVTSLPSSQNCGERLIKALGRVT